MEPHAIRRIFPAKIGLLLLFFTIAGKLNIYIMLYFQPAACELCGLGFRGLGQVVLLPTGVWQISIDFGLTP